MAKNYSKRSLKTNKIRPKKETIAFLLSYSKALSYAKIGVMSFEIISN